MSFLHGPVPRPSQLSIGCSSSTARSNACGPLESALLPPVEILQYSSHGRISKSAPEMPGGIHETSHRRSFGICLACYERSDRRRRRRQMHEPSGTVRRRSGRPVRSQYRELVLRVVEGTALRQRHHSGLRRVRLARIGEALRSLQLE
jgi:hypothetical protein